MKNTYEILAFDKEYNWRLGTQLALTRFLSEQEFQITTTCILKNQ